MIECPADLVFFTEPGRNFAIVIIDAPRATDNSGMQPIVTPPQISGEFLIGEWPVTFTARDSSGNTAQCVVHLIVRGMDRLRGMLRLELFVLPILKLTFHPFHPFPCSRESSDARVPSRGHGSGAAWQQHGHGQLPCLLQ